ncbi:phage Tail Collar domain protein [Acinetobacter baumannii 342950]|uniref:phage tail-collar fiber domain-containing protein n=1 Tax=Acinetobacter baumannii TaxID=470 RepID=UPI0004486FE6|nr:phage tail protein [Acinetobacter baumannii]EXC02602.1 phage Tail Collar domain protein [Acinetobacter baumannii 342950]
MSYRSIHTTKGLELLAQAESNGTQIRLTHMAVGDGGGQPIKLSSGMTQLVREKFRAIVNRVYQDPENDLKFTAELIIPANIGSFVMREIGVFDSNGNLFAVGNLPDITKPVAQEGIINDTVFRLSFFVRNVENVELKIDPNVVIATHSWIINTITTAKLLPGGTTGQILKKKSNTDGDVEWGNAAEVNIFVDSIEEEQVLATDQTHVAWSTVTTNGLAVYINGIRLHQALGADGWTANGATEIVLGKSYPAGTKILGVQNDPLGSAPYPLAKEENLSDVPDKTLARQNLNVFSKDETKANGLPPGTIVYFAMNKAPTGFLKANFAAVSRTVYADLFAAIGTIYGAGDGVNTFNVPEGRAEFPRGLDDGRGIDPGRVIGSWQVDSMKAHQHMTGLDHENEGGAGAAFGRKELTANKRTEVLDALGYTSNNSTLTESIGGTETRPRNVAWLCCIKY